MVEVNGHGFEALAGLRDQSEQKEEAEFLKLYKEVTQGHPETTPMAVVDAPDYLQSKGIERIEYLGLTETSQGAEEGKLLINIWTKNFSDENPTVVAFKIDKDGNMSGFTGGDPEKVAAEVEAINLTKMQLAKEVIRFMDYLGLGFFRKVDSNLFPEKEAFDAFGEAVDGAGEAFPPEDKYDPERLAFLSKLNGCRFGVTPRDGGLKKYRGVIMPKGIIYDCPEWGNAIYAMAIEDPRWNQMLETELTHEQEKVFISEQVMPLMKMFRSKKEARGLEGVKRVIHTATGNWKDQLTKVAENLV